MQSVVLQRAIRWLVNLWLIIPLRSKPGIIIKYTIKWPKPSPSSPHFKPNQKPNRKISGRSQFLLSTLTSGQSRSSSRQQVAEAPPPYTSKWPKPIPSLYTNKWPKPIFSSSQQVAEAQPPSITNKWPKPTPSSQHQVAEASAPPPLHQQVAEALPTPQPPTIAFKWPKPWLFHLNAIPHRVTPALPDHQLRDQIHDRLRLGAQLCRRWPPLPRQGSGTGASAAPF